ncbi:MAG: hypothetical protein ACTSXA_11860 [Candidatus Heimdallarchaeota archaeon]
MTLTRKVKAAFLTRIEPKLIFQKEKMKRGNGFKIYSDGIIEIKGKMLTNSRNQKIHKDRK